MLFEWKILVSVGSLWFELFECWLDSGGVGV